MQARRILVLINIIGAAVIISLMLLWRSGYIFKDKTEVEANHGNKAENVITTPPAVPTGSAENTLDVDRPNNTASYIKAEETLKPYLDDITSGYVWLDVKAQFQLPELPSGSEVTSLAVLLNYLGYDISKTTLAENYLDIGTSGYNNPYDYFIGDPFDESGFGCYAPALVNAAKNYARENLLAYTSLDVSGAGINELMRYVSSGFPVICWCTVNLDAPVKEIVWNIKGTEYVWNSNEHCVVLIGYDIKNEKAIVADPLEGIKAYDLNLFMQRYKEQGEQAMLIIPAK